MPCRTRYEGELEKNVFASLNNFLFYSLQLKIRIQEKKLDLILSQALASLERLGYFEKKMFSTAISAIDCSCGFFLFPVRGQSGEGGS